MTNTSLAESYLLKARVRLDVLEVFLDKEAYSDVVREAQEIVELALKGMLRQVGMEPPHIPIAVAQAVPAQRGSRRDRAAFPRIRNRRSGSLRQGAARLDPHLTEADPYDGRRFLRETDNPILFGKLNHRANDRHALGLRYNYTDYSRVSDFVGEESRRFVKSHSTVGSDP